MKRLTILALILAGLPALCLSQYGPTVSPLNIVRLSQPKLTSSVSLEQTLARRRNVTRFTLQQLDPAQISQLAWAGQGITDQQRGSRTAPSAGETYPIKLYFATQQGLFVYNPYQHSLERTLNQDIRGGLAVTTLMQEAVANAPCDIIIAGSARMLAARYGVDAGRYMLLEAGHIAQNIQLQAVSLSLGSVSIGTFNIRNVVGICNLPLDMEPLLIICVGYPAGQPTIETSKQQETRETDIIKRKKAVLIIASNNFRDEELFETKRVLDQAGIDTVIASTRTAVLKGMLGGRARAEILVGNIVVDDYDAVIFVGGLGAKQYFQSPVALNIAQEAVDKKKVLAAICVAPTVLANAGVLTGVRATSFLSERAKLLKAGAQYTGAPVERDGLIITGSGPDASIQFGRAIAETLAGR